jgi:hypothetical protein
MRLVQNVVGNALAHGAPPIGTGAWACRSSGASRVCAMRNSRSAIIPMGALWVRVILPIDEAQQA